MFNTPIQSPFVLAAVLVFTGLLLVACVTDFRERRISNKLVLILAVLGLAYSAITADSTLGTLRGVATLALGFAIWIPLYALGMLGAGDVKLFAAASAWLAPAAVINAAILTALAGGVLGVVWMFASYGSALAMTRLAHAVSKPSILREPLADGSAAPKLPYGIAMAVGLAAAAWLPRFPL